MSQSLERFPLSDEQRAAVFHATTKEDLAQIVGRAGAGKTTVARAIAECYRDQGYEGSWGRRWRARRRRGCREAGISARTLASLEYGWKEGRDRLHAGSVLVIDEAGMVDARELGRVLEHAAESRAKVVLLGDPDQIKAIGAGDAYRGLLEHHESARLETVRRQSEGWQRETSEQLAGGRVSVALDAYAEGGGCTGRRPRRKRGQGSSGTTSTSVGRSRRGTGWW